MSSTLMDSQGMTPAGLHRQRGGDRAWADVSVNGEEGRLQSLGRPFFLGLELGNKTLLLFRPPSFCPSITDSHPPLFPLGVPTIPIMWSSLGAVSFGTGCTSQQTYPAPPKRTGAAHHSRHTQSHPRDPGKFPGGVCHGFFLLWNKICNV